MDSFLKGFAGVAFGFVLFLPSYLFTREAVSGGALTSAPLHLRIIMFGGMGIMLLAPFVFWSLIPIKNSFKDRIGNDERKNKE